MSTPEHEQHEEEAQQAYAWLQARAPETGTALYLWASGTDVTATNLGRTMRGDLPGAQLLVRDWLVAGVLHWLYSEAEAGKTWFALWLALQVVRGDEAQGRPPFRVVYCDEELGEVEVAKRLRALGATPEEAEQIVYFQFPGWNAQTRLAWEQLLALVRPALVVFDTATDALTEAGLDENSGQDVTAWVKAYVEPATRLNATTLVLDHSTKATGGKATKYAVGSRAKRAKAKVQYHLGMKKGYDYDRLGRVVLTRTKNTLGAPLPEERTFTVGGDGEGNFIIRSAAVAELTSDAAEEAARETAVEQRVLMYLRERNGEPVFKSTAEKEVTGKTEDIRATLELLAADPSYPVEAVANGKRIQYRYINETEGA